MSTLACFNWSIYPFLLWGSWSAQIHELSVCCCLLFWLLPRLQLHSFRVDNCAMTAFHHSAPAPTLFFCFRVFSAGYYVCAGHTVKWPNTKQQGPRHFICAGGDGCHLSVSARSNCSERLERKGNSNTNTLCFVQTHLLPRCSTNGYPCPFLSVWTSPPLPPLLSLSSCT